MSMGSGLVLGGPTSLYYIEVVDGVDKQFFYYLRWKIYSIYY